MKFKIRFADQIVGILTIVAILALVFVLFMLGSKQRWFARDYNFHSVFESASGMNVGMGVLYKGFTIGKIKTITLNEQDTVDVSFYIYDTYITRIREGSIVELQTNPLGLSNQFYFHPGNGTELLNEGSFIPQYSSAEAIALIDSGKVTIAKKDDTISNIMAQVNPILSNLNETLSQINGALSGKGKGPIAETLANTAQISGNVAIITDDLAANLESILNNVKATTGHLESLSSELSDPTGLIPTLIDPEGTLFASIQESLSAVAGTLTNVEESSLILKSQTPQIARLIEDLRITLSKGQDVLEALRNNPILKGGVSERVETENSGTNSRKIEF